MGGSTSAQYLDLGNCGWYPLLVGSLVVVRKKRSPSPHLDGFDMH